MNLGHLILDGQESLISTKTVPIWTILQPKAPIIQILMINLLIQNVDRMTMVNNQLLVCYRSLVNLDDDCLVLVNPLES